MLNFPSQPVITKDNVTIDIDAVLYYRVADPQKATYSVQNLPYALETLTRTTLRNIVGDIELDRERKRVSRGGRPVELGPTEFRLLEFLLERPGRVFSRAQLLDGVWGSDVYIDDRTVDVHVGRLRKALNRGHNVDPIRTVRGSGYALDDRFGRSA